MKPKRKPTVRHPHLHSLGLLFALVGLIALPGGHAAAAQSRSARGVEAVTLGRVNLVAVAGSATTGVACGPGLILYSATTHQAWFNAAGADSLANYTAAVWAQGRFLVAAADGSIWRSTSANGSAFSVARQAQGEPIRGLGVLPGAVIAVGDNGAFLKSSDLTGGSWIAQDPLVSTTLRAVAAGLTSCVIVGDHGVILRGSAEGTGWSLVPRGITENLLAVTTNAFHQFLAVGEGGVAWKGEPDGTTWTRLDSFTAETLRGATQVGPVNVVVGDGGSIYLSSGIFQNWTQAVSPVAVNLNAVTYTGADVIAAGDHGRLLWSWTGLEWRLPIVPLSRTTWGSLKHSFSGR